MNVPDSVGVPLMVIVLDPQAALTPAGSPVAVPIPVAFVVVWVMLVNSVLMHKVGVDDGSPTVLAGSTVTVTDALAVLTQPSSLTASA